MTGELWQPDFAVYDQYVKEKRYVVIVDIGCLGHAPVAALPVMLHVRTKLQVPRVDGLRVAEETDSLNALDDKLVPAVEEQLGGRFVGRYTGGGAVSWVFYLPAGFKKAAEALPALVGDTAPYVLDVRVEDDPEWEYFFSSIAPSPFDYQRIMNRRVVDALVEAGDDLATPRELDHLAFFEEKLPAEEAARKLGEVGFAVGAPTKDPDGWRLEFRRSDALTGDRPDDIALEIFEIVDPLGGVYDGWGCKVAKKH